MNTTTAAPSAPVHLDNENAASWTDGYDRALADRSPVIDAEGAVWMHHDGGFRLWLPRESRFSTAHAELTRDDVVAKWGEFQLER